MDSNQFVKEVHEIDFDWFDSKTFVIDPTGQLVEAGTVLKLNQNIIFLKPLTKTQLIKFKDIINDAINHELAKR